MVAPDVAGAFPRGEPDAVLAVFKDYGKLVYALAFKVLGDRSLADEARKKTFVRAWRAAARYAKGCRAVAGGRFVPLARPTPECFPTLVRSVPTSP